MDISDELFCLGYQLRLFSECMLQGTLERWIEGYSPMQVQREHVQRYQLACRYTDGKRVLDLACGTGRGAQMMSQEGRAREVVACDIDPDAIRYAQLRYGNANTTFAVQDGLNFHPTQRFDVAVCFETIEHVSNPETLLQNLANILQPDGVLLVSTPISKCDVDPSPCNPYHKQEWGLLAFQQVIAQSFHIRNSYVQYYRIQVDNVLLRLFRKIRRFISGRHSQLTNPEPQIPVLEEWKAAHLDPKDVNVKWMGYQIIECSPLQLNSRLL